MSRENEIRKAQKERWKARYVPDSSLINVQLADISVTLAKISDSLERIAGYLESPYTVTDTAIAEVKETE